MTEDRMASEAAETKSEELYRLLAENSTDMILAYNAEEGRRQYISPASLVLTGYSPEEYLASDFVESVHPDDADRVARERDGTVKHGVPTRSTYRTRRKDGSYLWVEVRRSPTLDPETGKVRLMHAVVRDVNDRELAYQDLHASEERYRLLADNSTDMIGRIDLAGRQTYISPACLPIMGYTPDELVGLPAQDLAHPDDRHLLEAACHRLHAGEPTASVIYRAKRKDGAYLWLHLVMQYLRNRAGGEPVEIVTTSRDFSQQKAIEERLEAARAEAERANLARTAFFSNMSHELRTPLNAIIGYSEMIRGGTLGPLGNPKYKEYAAQIEAGGHLLLNLINDILDYAKVEAGELVLHEEPLDLGAEFRAAAGIVEAKALAGKVALKLEVATPVPYLRADPIRLKQILLNLLSNAIKFTPPGGEVVLSAAMDPEGSFVITVDDNGCGIEPEDLPRVFEAFWQADNARNRRADGTGLGLPLVKRLAEMHGGQVIITSEIDLGTRAIVTFPESRTMRLGA
ncbi:MAG TPA: PAS domain-containing sensor histidine kinase [Aliidongia sp.]|uniref:PAS domain-containing sensor histidine kinase n=1 Tax=Aliidongia sp. TaxID=1914230 RepID=UPI002DDD712A|nr:PAS domain-containing sensor histidine kinase [Aliidongia sp.]HEV2675053.1 PAS domain-containing sensor histidine kinase [Aliidongia sp.]